MSDESGKTLERQWTMLQSLPRAPLKMTAAELEERLQSEGFNVSRRTIERDLKNLSTRFPIVVDDRAMPFGWSWSKDAKFDLMPRLTTGQAVALLMAKTHLHDLLPQVMAKELQPLFETAQQSLAHAGWKDWHKRTAVIPAGMKLIPPTISRNVMNQVHSALARKFCLSTDYTAAGESIATKLYVHPLGLMQRGAKQYLVGTLFDYDNIVELPLHRMSAATLTDDRASSPKGFDFQTYAKTTARTHMSSGTIKLVAVFAKHAGLHLTEAPVSEDQTWKYVDCGTRIEIRATVADDELTRYWLMGFGCLVEVVSPKSLRAEFASDVQRMNQIYKGVCK